MGLTVSVKGIDQLADSLSSLPGRITAGVKVRGTVNAIKAHVWDTGYVTRTIKPGPKTLWSVNVFGDPKVLTITAPTGFIRIQRNEYLAILRNEFEKADFAHHRIADWNRLARQMMINTAQRCATIVADAAPYDTGELRDSISAAEPGDPALSTGGFDVANFLLGS